MGILLAQIVRLKNDAKRLSPHDRAKLLAWLCLYYDDDGERWGDYNQATTHRAQWRGAMGCEDTEEREVKR